MSLQVFEQRFKPGLLIHRGAVELVGLMMHFPDEGVVFFRKRDFRIQIVTEDEETGEDVGHVLISSVVEGDSAQVVFIPQAKFFSPKKSTKSVSDCPFDCI